MIAILGYFIINAQKWQTVNWYNDTPSEDDWLNLDGLEPHNQPP